MYIHGLLHRDISAGNLMFKEDGTACRQGVVIDFDFAIKLDALLSTAKGDRSVSSPVVHLRGPNTDFELEGNYSLHCDRSSGALGHKLSERGLRYT